MKYLPKIGSWGFIIGHRMINSQMWKVSYPNNIFGKIIEINENKIVMRCYMKKCKDGSERHPHIKTNILYFKSI